MLECLAAFEQWFASNGGWLHPDLELAHNDQQGVHVRVKQGASLIATTRVCSCPASLSFSCLNAIALSPQSGHELPWSALAASLPPEPVGWFFLMHEYLASTSSFWKPYIDSLPSPYAAERLGTLVFFQDEDLQWLGGTNLLAAYWQRTRAWQTYWRRGLEILKQFDWPVENYSWELFQWAATVYTSRSFTSLWLTSDAAEHSSIDPGQATNDGMHDLDKSVHQKTYRAYSRTDKDQLIAKSVYLPHANGPFQVLFPILDAFNHDHSAEVYWSFEKDLFSMHVEELKRPGEEVFNNYGRKANEELLMGYGFCISQNPWDRFALAFKPPSPLVQSKIRVAHPELFDAKGWDTSAATFYLPGPKYQNERYQSNAFSFWNALPPTLIELVFHMVMQERGKDVSAVDLEQYLFTNKLCSDIFAISRHLIEQFLPMLDRLLACKSALPIKSKNKFQASAQIYRDGQIRILDTIIRELRTVVQSIRPGPDFLQDLSEPDRCSVLLTLPEVFEIWRRAFPSTHQSFLSGVEQSANSCDIQVLQQAGWEEDIWPLWFCWLLMMHQNGDFDTCEDGSETSCKNAIAGWTSWLRTSYLPGILERVRCGALCSADPRTRFQALRDVDLGKDGDVAETALADLEDHLKDLMGTVRVAATSAPDSLWGDVMWSENLIAVWGLRIVKYECIERNLIQAKGNGGDNEDGLLMYLHRMDGKHTWMEDHGP